jgi:hypothetical protein
VWVTSVSRNTSPHQAADEAMWGLEKAHAALTGWRPTIGSGGAWKPETLTSLPIERDESLPDTVMYAVTTYGFTYQP